MNSLDGWAINTPCDGHSSRLYTVRMVNAFRYGASREAPFLLLISVLLGNTIDNKKYE